MSQQYGYPPPQQGFNQLQPHYQTQQQPYYQPQQQQQQWGLQQEPQQQYFGVPSGPTQGQPLTGVVPPSYDGTINPDSGLPSKFNPKPKYNDLWALVLWLLQLAAFVVLSYFAISQVRNDNTATIGPTLGIFSSSGLISLCISIGVGAVVSVLYFILIQAFPRQIIKITFLVSIVVYLAVAVYYLYRRLWIPGIIGLVFGVLYASMWWFWRDRIPFSATSLTEQEFERKSLQLTATTSVPEPGRALWG
ncbi:putative choline transporter, neither null mutation nor overexpression affects choline transport [Gryganskiella cystojenkinii]|nr:putative choline transporter, neither null mutation nor overexpression affects choline transport [Gryganskiella cystojenkinii]